MNWRRRKLKTQPCAKITAEVMSMIAFLRQEPGADVVENLLLDPNIECLAHSVNLCEVFYDFIKASDEPAAQSAVEDLKLIGVSSREHIDEAFWKEVVKYKANIRKISLADFFAVATVKREWKSARSWLLLELKKGEPA